ncbi:hypothetical protein [Pseudoalteromonas denitrificans]|uniref:Integrase catalytic domain-containing protein n=1 Tax=Pseudoalteromonas denitrificans DSM 6059 TaxID=1123010 RepID=A0A1I1U7Z9_9GAMM|nr:hypothetical protein [Pseudoalteromonas denitrificans]SFD66986.1 hypothetical protein SAMN02745724_05147 [Pseudoalteromonas denitrificans DSM 6059]
MGAATSLLMREFEIPEKGLCRVIQEKNGKLGFEEVANPLNGFYVKRDTFIADLNDDVVLSKPAANDEYQITPRVKRHIKKRTNSLLMMEVLDNLDYKPASKDTYKEFKLRMKEEYGDSCKIPGFSTLCGWWCDYRRANWDIARSIGVDPVASKRISEDQEKLIFKHLEIAFLTKNNGGKSLIDAHEDFKHDPEVALLKEKPVSYSTFNRRRKEILKIVEIMATGTPEEKLAAAKRYKGKLKIDRILERVEQDASRYNLSLLFDDGTPTEGVQIFGAVDCNSEYPLGIKVKFGKGESSADYQALFREVITGTRSGLKANGIPYMIVGDNSGGANSSVTREVYKNAEVKYHTLPPHMPWGKGYIEGFFQIFETGFLQGFKYWYTNKQGEKVEGRGIPGYLSDKEDYRQHPTMKARASMKVSEFFRVLDVYLHQYVNTAKKSLGGKTPQQVWNECNAAQNLPRLTVDNMNYAFMVTDTAVTQKLYPDGRVYFDNAYYQNEDLKQLHDELFNKGMSEVKVDICHSRFDVRQVKVIAQNPNGEGSVVTYPDRCTNADMDVEIPHGTDKPPKIERTYHFPTEIDAPLVKTKRTPKKDDKKEKDEDYDLHKRKVASFDLDTQIPPSLSEVIRASNAAFNTQMPTESSVDYTPKKRRHKKEKLPDNNFGVFNKDDYRGCSNKDESPDTDLNQWPEE